MKKLMIAAAVAVAAAAAMAGDGAVNLVKGFEGFRPTVYKCEADKSTIGYGSTSRAMVAKGRVTEADAYAELKRECDTIAVKLRGELKGRVILAECEEAALVSLIYNIGWGNFKGSTMLRLLKQGRKGAAVGAEFHKWVYVTKNGRKVKSKGLENRRTKEALCFLCGFQG